MTGDLNSEHFENYPAQFNPVLCFDFMDGEDSVMHPCEQDLLVWIHSLKNGQKERHTVSQEVRGSNKDTCNL